MSDVKIGKKTTMKVIKRLSVLGILFISLFISSYLLVSWSYVFFRVDLLDVDNLFLSGELEISLFISLFIVGNIVLVALIRHVFLAVQTKNDMVHADKVIAEYKAYEDDLSEIIPLRCIRCGSKRNLEQYKYLKVYSSKSGGPPIQTTYTRSYSFTVPACSVCKSKFETFKEHLNLATYSIIAFWVGFIVVYIVMEQLWTRKHPMSAMGSFLSSEVSLYLIFIGIYGLIFSLLIIWSLKRSVNNPNNYMSIFYQRAMVKPKNAVNWIPFTIWAKVQMSIEQNQQERICPLCLHFNSSKSSKCAGCRTRIKIWK